MPDVRDPNVLAGIAREIVAINASNEEPDYNRWLARNYDELMADEPPYDWADKEPR